MSAKERLCKPLGATNDQFHKSDTANATYVCDGFLCPISHKNHKKWKLSEVRNQQIYHATFVRETAFVCAVNITFTNVSPTHH